MDTWPISKLSNCNQGTFKTFWHTLLICSSGFSPISQKRIFRIEVCQYMQDICSMVTNWLTPNLTVFSAFLSLRKTPCNAWGLVHRLAVMNPYLVSKAMKAKVWIRFGSGIPPDRALKSSLKLLKALTISQVLPSSIATTSLQNARCLSGGSALHCPKSSRTRESSSCTEALR